MNGPQTRNLVTDEKRREVEHNSVKAKIDGEVNAEITARAAQATPADARRVESVAGQFRDQAIREVVVTEREAEGARRMARLSQFVDYGFYVVYTLLAIRLGLALIAARSSAGFVQFILTVTAPLCAPFQRIVPSPTAEGGYTLALPIVIAFVVYALLHLGVNGFLRLFASRKTEV
jgi:hypothetical protein